MSLSSPDSTPEQPDGLPSRPLGFVPIFRGGSGEEPVEDKKVDDLLPEWDVPAADIAAALPPDVFPFVPNSVTPPPGVVPAPLSSAEGVAEAIPVAAAVPLVFHCPVCQSTHDGQAASCADCGYHFAPADLLPAGVPVAAPAAVVWLQDRYELGARINERGGVERFHALDHAAKAGLPVPVMIVRQPLPKASDTGEYLGDEEILPSFDDFPQFTVQPGQPVWPSIAWERRILQLLGAAGPSELALFKDAAYEYLVEEVPTGIKLWDAWEETDSTADTRYGLLIQLADTMHLLHQNGAMLEGLRPDYVTVSAEGKARINDLSDLLPLPLPPFAPVRGSLYSAPELTSGADRPDARASLYSFGAMLYALHVGRELSDVDFDRPGYPKPFIPLFPDIHPAFGRLMMKTFERDVDIRFPTHEAARLDPTGFSELIRTLHTLRRTSERVRLEIACWTTTGMVRTGNEDAFAILHTCESRQDDVGEMALVLLCDGMGGYEAGEVAAALAIQALRLNLLSQKPFQALAGASNFPVDALGAWTSPDGHAPTPLDPEIGKQLLKAALKDVNKQVFAAARAPGTRRRGMGCTAEAVFVDGQHVIVGHVGDSRTYHLRQGKLIQLTRDQTLVNRLVELGVLTPEEAEKDERKNQLQQAIGGQPDVDPGLYASRLRPGDCILVCSDGVTNHVDNRDLAQMLTQEGYSADTAARRLVNLTNISGATDNATVVVIRCL